MSLPVPIGGVRRRRAALAAFCLLGGCLLPTLWRGAVAADAVSAVRWPAGLYNPHPLAGDLLLPLPCGGAMAFRPVPTPAAGRADPGTAGPGSAVKVLGPFGGAGDEGERHMLMGKYEVSALQFESVMSLDGAGACPDPEDWGRRVKVNLGWHEAVRFAHRWSLWLGEERGRWPDCSSGASPCLPRVDGIPAFVRLPLEAEWGLAALDGDGQAAGLPGEAGWGQGVEYEAWFNENADGRLRPIGLKRANALGLHDLLGNAEEIVLDLYRPDTRYPQAGGFVVRGGSIHSSRGEIAAGLRREVPFYGPDGAVGTSDTGFRVLASVPVYTSAARVEQVQSLLQGAASAPPVDAESDLRAEDPSVDDRGAAVGVPDMVYVVGGCFAMGSPEDEAGRFSDEVRHPVCVEGFYLGRYEVTFEEYDRFARETERYLPSDLGWGRGRRPVVDVSWEDAVAYARWLSLRTARTYRLPTEAEWEYAARAGGGGPFGLSGMLTTGKANYDDRYTYAGSAPGVSRGRTLPVGILPPNGWGLHDMQGNVWEWTCSGYARDYAGLELRCAPDGAAQDQVRVVRGGSWDSMPATLRIAHRFAMPVSYRSNIQGFRLVREGDP